MGYGLPAAIAAAICEPDREVYAIAGDGCFLMTCQELATAVHHDLTLTVIIIDNARYGTIRAHQEREYPARVSGTGLTNPDFCAFARSFGAQAEKAPDYDSFVAAVAAARTRGGVNLIEVPADPGFLSPARDWTETARPSAAGDPGPRCHDTQPPVVIPVDDCENGDVTEHPGRSLVGTGHDRKRQDDPAKDRPEYLHVPTQGTHPRRRRVPPGGERGHP